MIRLDKHNRKNDSRTQVRVVEGYRDENGKITIFGNNTRFDLDKDDQEMVNAVVLDVDDFSHKVKEIFTINLLGEKKNG